MCGVLGVYGLETVEEVLRMLSLLTHRGQDASGVLWVGEDDHSIQVVKDKTYPSLLRIPDTKATIAVGSTRYPTYGSRPASESEVEHYAQPFSRKTTHGDIGSVHNGQLTNTPLLSNHITYTSDSEVICHLLAQGIEKYGLDYPLVVNELMKLLDGSYAELVVVNTTPEPTLLAFRDPQGIRPLVMGMRGNTYLFASESVAIEQLGGTIVRDVRPGELVVTTKRGGEVILESHDLCHQSAHHCMFEFVYFASPASIIEERSVYKVRCRLGKALGREVLKRKLDVDYVVPVPDSSRISAQTIAEEVRVPLREAILKNRYHTARTFIMNDGEERRRALDTKYVFVSDYIKGKSLLVVDDSIVRGTTSKRLIQKLKEAGAASVYFASTCPPIIRPCYYGIDMTSDNDLIAHNKSLAEIQDLLGADCVIYQGIGDLFEAIGLNDLCTACVTGEYPTAGGRLIRRLLSEGKIDPNLSHYEQILEVQ